MRKIVCAAIKHGEIIICGARHGDLIMHEILKKMPFMYHECEQGFVDNKGVFVKRMHAFDIANDAMQVNGERNVSKKELYSEGLY